MLAVKKLCDIQRALSQAESAPGTLRRKAACALHLVTIEPPDSGAEGSSPHTPRMQTFQEGGLSAELQTAMSNHSGGGEDSLDIKSAVGMSRSQESIDARSRGSGRSQDPRTWSQESLDSRHRDLPEGYDQRPPQQQGAFKQAPLGTVAAFKYPPVPAKPRLAGCSSGVSPHGSPASKGFSYLRSGSGLADTGSVSRDEDHNAPSPSKNRTHSLTRYALSDGEPEEDEEEPAVPPGHLSSYATLTRKPGRSQLARLASSPEKNVGRSQSFAVRARKKGPPPPPPKRLSSVSSGTGGEPSADPPPGGAATGGSASVRRIATALESLTAPDGQKKPDRGQRPPSSSFSAPGQESWSPSTQTSRSSDTDQGLKSDSEEEEPKVSGLKGSSSPHNSSSECIPFAEEGNLTIKQRPKAPGPPRAEAVLEPPEKPPTANAEVPEFKLKESDTVKRRHKPRDKEQDGGSQDPEVAPTEHTNSWASAQSQEEARCRKADTSLESPATGPPIKPLLPSKPPTIAPKPVRHSLLAAQGKIVVRDQNRSFTVSRVLDP